MIWSDILRWNHVILRLGGMYWLMSLWVALVWVALIKNSGFVNWLEYAFAGVLKILTATNFPINVRALRFTVLELLKGFADNVTFFEDYQEKLESISQENILAEHK